MNVAEIFVLDPPVGDEKVNGLTSEAKDRIEQLVLTACRGIQNLEDMTWMIGESFGLCEDGTTSDERHDRRRAFLLSSGGHCIYDHLDETFILGANGFEKKPT